MLELMVMGRVRERGNKADPPLPGRANVFVVHAGTLRIPGTRFNVTGHDLFLVQKRVGGRSHPLYMDMIDQLTRDMDRAERYAAKRQYAEVIARNSAKYWQFMGHYEVARAFFLSQLRQAGFLAPR